MRTDWGQAEGCTMNEHPRPQLKRERFMSLCGEWDFAITETETPPQLFDGAVSVPFSPECALSGAGALPAPGQYIWYRKKVSLPLGFCRGRLLLHFDGVIGFCDVWVDESAAISHAGGFAPFSADITELAGAEGFAVVVRCLVPGGDTPLVRGDMDLYGAQCGIWQSVWLESVPENYIRALRLIPHLAERRLEIWVSGSGEVRASIPGQEFFFPAGRPALLDIADVRAWTPEEPYLYPLRLTLGDDEVESYFAMRSISVGYDERGERRIMLNGEPYFINGVIDSGRWPGSGMTPPSDEAALADLQTAKDMGFNAVRKTGKTEPDRWYYHCDRLGLLVWQDIPAGGGKMSKSVSRPGKKPAEDFDYAAFGRSDEASRLFWRREAGEIVYFLGNHPCIVEWTAFDEGRGQFDAYEQAVFLRRLDGLRLCDPASGWHDTRRGELRSIHDVSAKPLVSRDEYNRALALTSFGALSHRVEGHCPEKKTREKRRFGSPNSLAFALRELYSAYIAPAKKTVLSAAFYSRLTDTETQLDGLVTFDRRVKKLAVQTVRDIVSPRPKKKR